MFEMVDIPELRLLQLTSFSIESLYLSCEGSRENLAAISETQLTHLEQNDP